MTDRDDTVAPFLLIDQRSPRKAEHLAGFLLVMVAAELGRFFWVGSPDAALIWPPGGLALAFALAFGVRVLPTLSAGLLVWAIALRGLEPALWLLPALALMLGPLIAMVALNPFRPRARAYGPMGELLAFWAAGLGVAVVVSSVLGAVNMTIHELFPELDFAAIWAGYWTSEAFGTLIFAPLVLRLIGRWREPATGIRIELQRSHLLWLAALALLVIAQWALSELGPPAFAEALGYFYFPLLAICAGLGSVVFTDAMIALVGTGIVTLTLVGGAGLGPTESNFELVDTILLVTAVTIMAQLVNAMAATLRRHLMAEREAARRDFLTGLANDRALGQALGSLNDGGILALVDVAAIRRALDLVGLEGADELERRVADRLRDHAGGATTVARLGRGLFGLLWPSRHDAAVQDTLQACYDAIDGQRLKGGGLRLTLRPTIGAVSVTACDEANDELLAMASQSLQQAAESAGQRLSWLHADRRLLESARADQNQVEQLRAAIASPSGFVLMAQPIVALQTDGNQGPFHELLLRWPRDNGGVSSPAGFLTLAARHGLMPEIDRWVIDRGLALAADHAGRVSINLSGASLADEGLVDWIEQRRSTHGAVAARVCFEITETESIQGLQAAAQIVTHLRDKGYRVALDDFGTGHASFEYLRKLPFDYVKIDGSFVRAAMDSPTDAAMVEAIRSVAATAGLITIAEFVEDDATRAWLTRMGVDFGQGFGIGAPMSVECLSR
jgi:EAL domain-containing protein (putative c-di-GMP-specific phosphodiesterase class I)